MKKNKKKEQKNSSTSKNLRKGSSIFLNQPRRDRRGLSLGINSKNSEEASIPQLLEPYNSEATSSKYPQRKSMSNGKCSKQKQTVNETKKNFLMPGYATHPYGEIDRKSYGKDVYRFCWGWALNKGSRKRLKNRMLRLRHHHLRGVGTLLRRRGP